MKGSIILILQILVDISCPFYLQSLLVIHIDGASRGNPVLSGMGMLIMKGNLKIYEHKEFIGQKTNNQTEYIALKKALQLACSIVHDCAEITILSDSELVVNQRNKRYRVRNKQLKIILREITNLEKKFRNVIYTHIPRENNILADLLANQAIDENVKYQKSYSKANGSGEDSELSLNYVAQMRKRHLTELPLKKESKGLSN